MSDFARTYQTPADKIRALEAELEEMRSALAYEARVVEAQTDLAAIKGRRKKILVDSIERMRQMALSDVKPVSFYSVYAHTSAARYGMSSELRTLRDGL